MNSPYKAVQILMDTKLATITDLPTIITENETAFLAQDTETNPLTSKYIRTSINPFQTEDLSVGIGGCDVFSGFFVVEIFTPIGNGISETNHWVDEIINNYPKKDILTDGTLNVHIIQYSRMPAIPFVNYHKGGVLLIWNCFVQR